MRTRFILSFIAALFMQFTTVSADNYTDGLMKLMNNEAVAIINTKMLELKETPHSSNINAEYFKNQVKIDAVEWMADHYRKNMSEKDFNDFISFFMQPEILSVQKKAISAATSGEGAELTQILSPLIQTITTGGTLESPKEPECDPLLKKELLRWMEINSVSEGLKAVMGTAKSLAADRVPADIPEEQKTMAIKTMEKTFSYLEDNMTSIVLAMMIGKVDLKDMQILNAIENKPFFANYKKANLSMASDISTFMNKVVAGMKKD